MGCAFEDAIHYILECCLYNKAREELKLRLVFINELKIEVLLFGDDTLTEMQNLQIFKSVQKQETSKVPKMCFFCFLFVRHLFFNHF